MRVLEVLSNLDGGGVDRLLYDYCTRIAGDISFDFVVQSEMVGMLEKPLREKLGCNIFHVCTIHENLVKHYKELKRIISNGHYDIVHTHGNYKGVLTLLIAKYCGVKVRIVHSHIAFIPENNKEKLVRKVFTWITKKLATDLFACGRDAACWMWGNEEYQNGKVFVMPNAVNTEQFLFSEQKRNKVRKENMLDDSFVIGNVARLSYQKNHSFLLDVFKEILDIEPNAKLLLVGRGELEQTIREKVSMLELDNSVIFFGVRNDVPDLINGMDVFLLPSLFEGLPVTLVEAQANGIPVVAADSITDEIKLIENVHYLPLSLNSKEWAKIVCAQKGNRIDSGIKGTQYDIDVAAKLLKDKYFELCRMNEC